MFETKKLLEPVLSHHPASFQWRIELKLSLPCDTVIALVMVILFPFVCHR